jgi:hypothetical protein
MNLDQILLLPDLSLSQSVEQLEQQLNEWKDKQFGNIEMIYNQSIEKIHLVYRKSLDDFEQAKTKVMDDFNHIVDDCSAFTNDELDMYLKRILTNVEKLKTITPVQLQESDSSINISFQPILISQWMDPWKIHFSQSTVHGNRYLAYQIAMTAGRWIWDRYPDEHQTPSALRIAFINGHFVSFDNRRLYAAQESRLKRIPVIQVNLDDIRPTTNMTWRKSFENRLKQSKLPSEGTSTQPLLKL